MFMHRLLLACSLLAACSGGQDPKISHRFRTSPALRSFASCDELADALRSHLKEEMRVQLEQQEDLYARGGAVQDAAAPTAGATDSNASSDTRQEGVDYSGTNNQESGVDEADFVKTDGYYLYVINGNRLEIFGVPTFGELVPSSSTLIEGQPTQLLVAGDRAVVFSSIYPWNLPAGHPLATILGRTDIAGYGLWYRASSLAKLTVLDLSSRANPKVLRELYLEGYYQTARKIDGSVRMISYSWLDIPNLRYWVELPNAYYSLDPNDPDRQRMYANAVEKTIAENDHIIDTTPLADFVPQIYERTGNAVVAHPFTTQSCQGFSIADDGMSRGFTSIMTLDLFGDVFSFDADHIVSNWSTVYASPTTLLIAEPAEDWWWYWNNEDFKEMVNIHRFDISTPGVTTYAGSGRVLGQVRDQFSLSEREGLVRVATTTNPWNWWWMTNTPAPQPDNHLFVISDADSDGDGTLDTIGTLDGIATGERIWSSRFVDDKAYLVTFRNIDPLWTIDLSDPQAPHIVGELEVPGVSTYIHPLGDHLLTIGFGGNDTGLNWTTQLSLFDVSDFGAPTLTASLPLAPPAGDGWTYAFSEATYEHKAFQYWAPLQLLAVPLSTYRYSYVGCPTNDVYCSGYQYEYKSRLALIKVDPQSQSPLSFYGDIDHSDFFNSDSGYYWEWRDVRRTIFMGDYIYAVSDRGITVHKAADLSPVTSVSLPGSRDEPFWAL